MTEVSCSSMNLCEDYFSTSFHTIANEACLIEGLFYSGLTHLRNSSSSNISKAYVGFYNISIAIEKICKLIMILDYMVENNLNAPNDKHIKKYKHNITKIIDDVILLSRKYNKYKICCIKTSSTLWKLLKFLEDFAIKSRYENLDGLCNTKINVDHMQVWASILEDIANYEINERYILMAQKKAEKISSYFNMPTIILHFNYANNLITDNKIFYNHIIEEMCTARAVRHLVLFIEKLCLLTWEINSLAMKEGQKLFPNKAIFPHLNEFFRGILTSNQNILKKKRWCYP